MISVGCLVRTIRKRNGVDAMRFCIRYAVSMGHRYFQDHNNHFHGGTGNWINKPYYYLHLAGLYECHGHFPHVFPGETGHSLQM